MHVSATPTSFHSVDTCEMKVTNIIWHQTQSFKCWNEEKSLSSFSLLYGWDTRKHDCVWINTTKVYDCRLEPAEWFMKASIKITLSRPAVGQSRGQILTTISQEMALTQKKNPAAKCLVSSQSPPPSNRPSPPNLHRYWYSIKNLHLRTGPHEKLTFWVASKCPWARHWTSNCLHWCVSVCERGNK